MRYFFTYLLMSLVVIPLFAANDVVRVSAKYEYASSNPHETPEQAEQTAILRAKQKALENEFGLDVANITNTFISNQSNASSQTNVFSIGETAVRGEWIETTKVQVLEKNFTKGFWIVQVYVEGKARKNAAEKADIRFAFVRAVGIRTPPLI